MYIWLVQKDAFIKLYIDLSKYNARKAAGKLAVVGAPSSVKLLFTPDYTIAEILFFLIPSHMYVKVGSSYGGSYYTILFYVRL